MINNEENETKESFNELINIYNAIDENEIKHLKSNYNHEQDEYNFKYNDLLLQDLF
jgi:hypothetical protein